MYKAFCEQYNKEMNYKKYMYINIEQYKYIYYLLNKN